MRTVYRIPQKSSNSGSIHDLASDQFERGIVFEHGCKYAVVLASYYGGKGYTTHKTEATAIAASRRAGDFSYGIIDASGRGYSVNYDHLIAN